MNPGATTHFADGTRRADYAVTLGRHINVTTEKPRRRRKVHTAEYVGRGAQCPGVARAVPGAAQRRRTVTPPRATGASQTIHSSGSMPCGPTNAPFGTYDGAPLSVSRASP